MVSLSIVINLLVSCLFLDFLMKYHLLIKGDMNKILETIGLVFLIVVYREISPFS